MSTIAYQGIKGAYSYITAVREFGQANVFLGMAKFGDVFHALESGHAGYAVVPIENSLIGSIYEIYDLLNTYEMHIVGEHFTKIDHCLLVVPVLGINKEERIRGIKKVFSHVKALEQCSSFFRMHPWIEPVIHMDTGGAAAEIAELGAPEFAAIASAGAGEIYGLELLENGIEDNPKNYTRFVTLVKKCEANTQCNKCSLLLKLNHTPGALVEVLKPFAGQGINLTKIESRPIRGSQFEYLFYLDFEFRGHRIEDVKSVLNALSEKVKALKILGFYKAGHYGNPETTQEGLLVVD